MHLGSYLVTFFGKKQSPHEMTQIMLCLQHNHNMACNNLGLAERNANLIIYFSIVTTGGNYR